MIPKRKKVSDDVVEEIIRMMTEGKLREGDILPNQIEFAAQLGVSRLSLREGLHTLQMLGVVEQRPKIGTRILNDKPDTWEHKLNIPLLADKSATMELLESRSILETQIAGLIADRATPDDIIAVGKTIDVMENSIQIHDLEGYLLADLDFHKALASSCHNRYLINMLYNVVDLLEEFMREVFNEIPVLLPSSYEMHNKIFAALKEGNKEELVSNMSEHLSLIKNTTVSYYKTDANV